MGYSAVETLILSRSEVAALLEPHIVLTALREAFIAYSTSRTIDAMRIPLALPPPESRAASSGMLLAPGLVPGIPAYSVKVHAKFPGQDPAIRGVLVLHDLTTGAVIALIESSHLTALRTGLAGALGADALTRWRGATREPWPSSVPGPKGDPSWRRYASCAR
jgi:ornithine cyclodeaminase/alanine dehydrogenase-like protein (mu-crystallin family)